MNPLLPVIALASLAGAAPPQPDLSGRWQLNVARSAYEQSPGPRAEVETITQTPTHVRLQIVSITRDITTRYDMTLPTDGKVIAVPGGQRVDPARILRSVSARWDGPVLTVREELETDTGPFVVLQHYERTKDDETLAVRTSTPDGRVLRTLVFDRCREGAACR